MDWDLFWTVTGVLTAIAVPVALWVLERRGRTRATDIQEFTIEGADWVVETGLSYRDLLQKLISLDHATLAELDDKTEGNGDQWAPIFAKSPETWSLVVFRNKVVVGYWSFFSLSPKLIATLKTGRLYDSRLKDLDVRRIIEPGPHSLYFVMLARHPDFSNTGGIIFQLLMRSLADCLDELLRDGLEVDAVYADAMSREGRALCENLGFEGLMASIQGGTIYRTALSAGLLNRLRRFGARARPRLSLPAK